ncbi:hypothetical protein Vretifemale_10088 [Volvox reticuliferus]|uniref:ubiquitinyl hydrolase 1 n=1 Tax=Volvox reticuliferus TaxID=1737510 RepID=A0A8J4CH90_9CHLO|nr:hypothetical protein Vretifemale_10088 [Volvox reticuliferus]
MAASCAALLASGLHAPFWVTSPAELAQAQDQERELGLTGAHNGCGYGVGLANPNSYTCFMNSTLQCLSGCRRFSKPCMPLRHSRTCPLKAAGSSSCACCALERQLREMLVSADGTALSPDEVVSVLNHISPAFKPGKQQDAQEFWVKLLEMLGEEANLCKLMRASAAADTAVHQAIQAAAAAPSEPKDLGSVESTERIFTGTCQNGRRCFKCQHVTSMGAPEDYQTLFLPIGKANSVAKALDNYMNGGSFDTKHYCAVCGRDEEAKPAASLLSAPDVLVLALKRFQNSEMDDDGFGTYKIDNYVEFSTTIDLQPFMLPGHSGPGDVTYELAGIVVHHGDLEGGHYVAYIRGNGDTWWCKNDDCAVKVPLEEVLVQKAYMLFYERVMLEQANSPTTATGNPAAEHGYVYDVATTALPTTSLTTTSTTTTSSYVTANEDCSDLSTSTTSHAISGTAAAATLHGYWCRAAAAGAATTTITSGSLHAATMATAATIINPPVDDLIADTAASGRRRYTHRRERGFTAAARLPPQPANAVMAQPPRKRLASHPPGFHEESDVSFKQDLKKPRLGTGMGFNLFKWPLGDLVSSAGAVMYQWSGVLLQRH